MEQEITKDSNEENCRWCGERLMPPDGTCPKCDIEDNANKPVRKRTQESSAIKIFDGLANQTTSPNKQGYDWLIALLLCFFVGIFGAHRFYTGNTLIGLGQFFTFGGCGLWTMIDFVLIATNTYKDGNGKPLVKSGST